MKQVYIIHEHHPKLLLLFAGWAADETLFRQYRPQGMDYMICYDYRTLDFDESVFSRYRQVNVVAWSMGVWVASLILCNRPRKNIFSIAFNGSTRPISDPEGIPSKIFQGTLDGLTLASLQKFLRRMCKDGNAYKAFMQITPRRDFDEIKEELRRIQEQYFELAGAVENETDDEKPGKPFDEYFEKYHYEYDYTFVGLNDRIFPVDNLLCCYEGQDKGVVIATNSAHYDESMFRFLLQDMWEMPIEDFMCHIKSIKVEYNR